MNISSLLKRYLFNDKIYYVVKFISTRLILFECSTIEFLHGLHITWHGNKVIDIVIRNECIL